MPSITQVLVLGALPIIGFAIFWSSWIQELTTSHLPKWYTFSSFPQVKISQGVVVGTILDNKFPAPIEAFMGLPYAQAPTGDRRFRRAVPVVESNHTFNAQKYGPMFVTFPKSIQFLLMACSCPGKQLLSGKPVHSSEDCMTVNIFRQKPEEKGKKIPVAVYIHGGAFNRGNGKFSMAHMTILSG
jgi:triacylglycerol lipase